jgi:glycogen synthase
MPSKFEPCGLPQMIGPLYGSLPIVHNTGGLHDTVTHINTAAGTGNGFVFNNHDSQGLKWAIDQAMIFHSLPGNVKSVQISRIMNEAKKSFNHSVTAQSYIKLYEKMMDRKLVPDFRQA